MSCKSLIDVSDLRGIQLQIKIPQFRCLLKNVRIWFSCINIAICYHLRCQIHYLSSSMPEGKGLLVGPVIPVSSMDVSNITQYLKHSAGSLHVLWTVLTTFALTETCSRSLSCMWQNSDRGEHLAHLETGRD